MLETEKDTRTIKKDTETIKRFFPYGMGSLRKIKTFGRINKWNKEANSVEIPSGEAGTYTAGLDLIITEEIGDTKQGTSCDNKACDPDALLLEDLSKTTFQVPEELKNDIETPRLTSKLPEKQQNLIDFIERILIVDTKLILAVFQSTKNFSHLLNTIESFLVDRSARESHKTNLYTFKGLFPFDETRRERSSESRSPR